MIKLIVSDLDGTLLDENIKVRERDIKSIHKAQEMGINFCLATGRKDLDIIEVSKMIDRTFHRISQNGAFIVLDDQTDFHSTFFESSIAQKIYSHVVDKEVLTLVSTRDTEIIDRNNEIVERIQKVLFSPLIINPNLYNDIGVTIHPSKIIVTGKDEVIEELQTELLQAYPNEIDAFISAKYTLDIMPKNISKGNAVKKLAERIGISLEEIACIGDSFNDVSMLQVAKYGFAMSKAKQGVKECADYVVESVGEAIEIILEINSSETT
ncbi:Cof subfamily protein (haloacid dehalogenase superfamily) [Bacillus mesophilus]|uniref:HAD family hydrolase n=1 Tax=Bacillus mesophilus TaxID=1808955 RepID=A0A6M0Q8G3_9BACI|nr:HAD family hydrolase [Bacillus mesophilus]MBM7661989.1 Cof subfamily protein (haloacid dehalogenase superfamily) [Bacillus mesophilus]NEY72652.1 HAD family hydrolase [Bacillus mesophilus]